jgi:hypothetical protein
MVSMMTRELPDTTRGKFHKENTLICPDSVVPLNNFETSSAAVEKYLSDNAPLSADRKEDTSYLTGNQRTIDTIFALRFQSI